MAKFYYAYFKSDEIGRSASGGIAYALSAAFIKEGRVVYGVEYTPDFRSARYARAESLEEIDRFRGSKYIETEKKLVSGKPVFQSVAEDLLDGRKVFFVGLPCEVAMLYTFLGKKGIKRNDAIITADLICQGPLHQEAQAQYLAYLEEKYKSKIVDFSVRYKNPYWEPVYLRAAFANGKEHVRNLYETDFGRALAIFGRDRCFKCAYKDNDHKADLTLGDLWGLSPKDSRYNRMGTSVVVAHTERGDKAFLANETIVSGRIAKKEAFKEGSMYLVSRTRKPALDTYLKVFKEEGLHAAVFRTRSTLSKGRFFAETLLGRKPY